MLQQETPDDYVIATDKRYSVKDFIKKCCKILDIDIEFQGTGVDDRYFRPTEVETLLGDSTKAKSVLGWQPKITLDELCEEMMLHDMGLT